MGGIPLILPVVVVVVVVVAVVDEETGAALVQPPKSSSAVTVVGGFDAVELGAPQPVPISLAVSFSGTFIEDAEGSAGAGSGVLHALPSNGSKLDDSMLGGTAVVVAAAAGSGPGCGRVGAGGFERLKAELSSC